MRMFNALLASPSRFLQICRVPSLLPSELSEYEAWWRRRGRSISAAIDAMGTPWLKMFDADGSRIDRILYPPDYWRMLKKGYTAGHVWRCFEKRSLQPFFELGYVTAFFDPGLLCPYTVSLSTAVPLYKYGDPAIRERYLPRLLARDKTVWQGATWMTEINGGSDLGSAVFTIAINRENDDYWLTGEKYFCSNAGAELALVVAHIAGEPSDVRGLGLFLVPKYRDNGELNYTVRRLKNKIATRSVPTGEVEFYDSVGWKLGPVEGGIYRILEVLNISRVANSIGSVALMQRAIADARAYACKRTAFDRRIIKHPLLARQFTDRKNELRKAFALAWASVDLLEQVWQEKPPYSDTYHAFRLLAHLAKYWTAERAVQTAKWAMEVYAGIGTLAEFEIERLLREAMILQIWEGTPHRQILDALEVIERKQAHRLLFEILDLPQDTEGARSLFAAIETLLERDLVKKEAGAEKLILRLAEFLAEQILATTRGLL